MVQLNTIVLFLHAIVISLFILVVLGIHMWIQWLELMGEYQKSAYLNSVIVEIDQIGTVYATIAIGFWFVEIILRKIK